MATHLAFLQAYLTTVTLLNTPDILPKHKVLPDMEKNLLFFSAKSAFLKLFNLVPLSMIYWTKREVCFNFQKGVLETQDGFF